MTTHIVLHLNVSDGIDLAIAECGAVGMVMPDASLKPDSFDFHTPPNVHKATCEACRRELAAKNRAAMKHSTFSTGKGAWSKAITFEELQRSMDELRKIGRGR